MKVYHQSDLDKMEKRYRAAFVNSLSGFKSANLIGTQNSQGQSNLAIFSSAFHLGSDPALLAVISRPNTVARHTIENIQENGHYTLNHVSEQIYKKAHQTSARYPRETSEFDAVGLNKEYLENFKAPFVQESNIKMALKLCEIIHIKRNKTDMLIGEIAFIVLPDNIVQDDGYLDIEAAQTICLSGLDRYHKTTQLSRLPYAKP